MTANNAVHSSTPSLLKNLGRTDHVLNIRQHYIHAYQKNKKFHKFFCSYAYKLTFLTVVMDVATCTLKITLIFFFRDKLQFEVSEQSVVSISELFMFTHFFIA